MHIHCIGIGGIGLSAFAQLCKELGHTATGSDAAESPMVHLLRSQGINVQVPHDAENITSTIDTVVYSEAIPFLNPERTRAQELHIPQKSYFQALGEMTRQYKTIVVAGTHGKTTTVGMLASGFLASDFDLSVIVGAQLQEFNGSNFHQGSNDWLLVEGCEYRNNFRFLKPEVVVLTNVELDHVDFYQSEEQYEEAFRFFLNKAKAVLYHEGDMKAERLLTDFQGQKIPVPSHAFSPGELTTIGKHNQMNATLALKLGELMKQDMSKFSSGVAAFPGAARRQQFLGTYKGIRIYDDYGHHPTEIAATLSAFREAFPSSQIALVFEPHQFSRTKHFFDQFIEAFSHADKVGIAPIYAARDTDEDKAAVSTESLISALPNAQQIQELSDAQDFASDLKEEDILLFMGAGNIDRFAHDFLSAG